MSYTLVYSDAGPQMDIALTTSSGVFVLQALDTAVLCYVDPVGARHEVPLVIDDAAAGLCHRVWSAGDLPVAGLYQGQIEVRRSTDASFPRTLPNDGTFVYWPVQRKI